MGEPIVFILQFVLRALAVLFLARFVLQAARADFYNPISQGIVRYTDPVLAPLRRVIPPYKNLDFAAFAATWLVNIAIISLTGGASGMALELVAAHGAATGAVIGGVYSTLDLFLSFYWIVIFLTIIASFLAAGSYNPVIALLQEVCEPLLAPARRLLPSLGGLDLSPLLVFLALALVQRFFLPGLFRLVF